MRLRQPLLRAENEDLAERLALIIATRTKDIERCPNPIHSPFNTNQKDRWTPKPSRNRELCQHDGTERELCQHDGTASFDGFRLVGSNGLVASDAGRPACISSRSSNTCSPSVQLHAASCPSHWLHSGDGMIYHGALINAKGRIVPLANGWLTLFGAALALPKRSRSAGCLASATMV